jgi:cysteine desulfurase
MTPIYFDNAATTALEPRVKEAIIMAMDADGNPSSSHALGRKSKALIESSRTQVSGLFGCQPSEIIFTSGGTEADNLAILGSVETGEIDCVISSQIEHPAIKDSIAKAHKLFKVEVKWVKILANGSVDLADLELLLQTSPKALVSLMHVNNEIGNILDVEAVGQLCQRYSAIFHSDMVQSIGHFPVDLNALPVDLASCSAHKIHGPKGMGFLYRKKGVKLSSQSNGGKQEREARGGTENLIGIIGFAKALEIALSEGNVINQKIIEIKRYFIEQLQVNFDSVQFNGLSGDIENSVNSVLSVNFPNAENNDMLLFQLDLKGICVSGGSACSSGALKGSAVLNEIGAKGASIRFSFNKENTKEEVNRAIELLKEVTV